MNKDLIANKLVKVAKKLIAGEPKKVVNKLTFNGKKAELAFDIFVDMEDKLFFPDMEILFSNQSLYKTVGKFRQLFHDGLKGIYRVNNYDEWTYLNLRTKQKVVSMIMNFVYTDDAENHKQEIIDFLKKNGFQSKH